MTLPPAIKKSLGDCPVYRISPADTNYFALVFDPPGEGCDLVAVVEIFAPGGRTPPNAHRTAHEMFFVLAGEGRARAGGDWIALAKGDALMIKPGTEHVVENTGSGKLYCLTCMVPDEAFAALIRSGTPMTLDDEDRRVLGAA